jgi:hypothetical protein
MATYADRIKVFIPQAHLAHALADAAKRNGKEEQFGAMTYVGSKNCHEGLAAHELGIRAELGMSLYWGADYDRRVFESNGDDGRDMILPPPWAFARSRATRTTPTLTCVARSSTTTITSTRTSWW